MRKPQPLHTPALRRYIGLAAALLGLSLSLSACSSSITTSCEEAAQSQCKRCYECQIGGDAPVSGAALCDLHGEQDQSQCEQDLTARCENQAGGRKELEDEFTACIDSLESQTCDALHLSYAQDKPSATNACGKLF